MLPMMQMLMMVARDLQVEKTDALFNIRHDRLSAAMIHFLAADDIDVWTEADVVARIITQLACMPSNTLSKLSLSGTPTTNSAPTRSDVIIWKLVHSRSVCCSRSQVSENFEPPLTSPDVYEARGPSFVNDLVRSVIFFFCLIFLGSRMSISEVFFIIWKRPLAENSDYIHGKQQPKPMIMGWCNEHLLTARCDVIAV